MTHDDEHELRALAGYAWELRGDPEQLRDAVERIVDFHDRRHVRAYERRLRSTDAVLQVLRETDPARVVKQSSAAHAAPHREGRAA
ncbi:MAG: hypothetical protein ACJ75Q_00595 [Gaiellaceae bacterium]